MYLLILRVLVLVGWLTLRSLRWLLVLPELVGAERATALRWALRATRTDIRHLVL